MQQVIIDHGLPLASALVLISALGIPTGIPVRLVLVAIGAFVARSLNEMVFAWLLLVLADFVGTMTLMFAARHGGARILQRYAAPYEAQARITLDRWRARLGHHDPLVVFVLRLMPGIRFLLVLGGGALGLRPRDFAFGALPSGVIWIGLPLWLGWIFRENLAALPDEILQYGGFAVAIIALVIGGIAYWRYQRRHHLPIPEANTSEIGPNELLVDAVVDRAEVGEPRHGAAGSTKREQIPR